MALPPVLRDRRRLPVIGSPLFIISNPDLVIAQCKAGVVGAFPALNARPVSMLDEWLRWITEELAAWDRDHPEAPSAPFAVHQMEGAGGDHLAGRADAGERRRPLLWRGGAARRDQRPLCEEGHRERGRRPDPGGRGGRRPCRPPVALRPDPGPEGMVRLADRAARGDRAWPVDPGGASDGGGPGLR